MCMPSAPEYTPVESPPTPTYEQATETEAETTARRTERKRAKQAFNQRSTLLDQGSAGFKTLLGD